MSLKVLVIDDQRDFIEMIQAMLEPLGYEIAGCTKPADARQQATVFQPDVILLDLMMPGLSGFDLINIFENDPALRSIPIILTTAAADLIVKNQRILEARGLTILPKPFGFDDLIAKLHEAHKKG